MNRVFDWGRLIFAGFAAAVMSLSLPIAAEEGDAQSTIEEIVVTATYRETDLMDTPITITALSEVEIDQRGIEDISNLMLSIPGLNYGMATATYHRVSARGIDNLSFGMSPSVSTYVDNLPVSGVNEYRQPLAPIFDLERIEVLKGPQGTLYGEGSMAGAIRYVTKGPSPEGFEYGVKAKVYSPQYSKDIGHRVDAMVNVPLSENAAARITAYSRYKAGVIDQHGTRIESDVDFTGEKGGRIQVAFFPTDSLEISAMAHMVDTKIGGPGIAHHCYVDERPDSPSLPGGSRAPEIPLFVPLGGCETGHNGTYDGETALYKQGGSAVYRSHLAAPAFQGHDGGASSSLITNLSLEWEGPGMNVIASSSHYDIDIWYAEEQRSGFNVRYFPNWNWACGEVAGCEPYLGTDKYDTDGVIDARSSASGNESFTDRWAHEIRLVSTTDSRLQWTAGVYKTSTVIGPAEKNWGPCRSSVTYTAPDITCQSMRLAFDPRVPVAIQQEVARKLLGKTAKPGAAEYEKRGETAVFGEATYELMDRLSITAGIRWAETSASVHIGAAGVYSPLSAATATEVETKDNAYAPKVTLSWRPNDTTLVYAMWASGFRGGGVNKWVAAHTVNFADLCTQNIPGACAYLESAQKRLTFNGDSMITYELGLKTTVGNWDIMGSVYSMNLDDAVIHDVEVLNQVIDPDTGVSLINNSYIFARKNAGESEATGVELEVRGQLSDQLSFRGGGAWVPDAEIKSQAVAPITAGALQRIAIKGGNRVQLTPKWSGFASLLYDFELGGFNATLRSDLSYRGSVFRSGNNERPSPDYWLTNVKLILSRSENTELGFYIENIFDEIASYGIGDSGYHGFNRPRTFGVTYSYTN